MFGLADCNNFYVSCERLFNPSLNGLPVVVLSNNDGCVISRSQEAKALGIAMGEPLFKIKELVEREGVKIYSSNFPLYADLSSRVMEVITSMVPAAQIYSIDEAFIDFEGLNIDELTQLSKEITKRVKRWTGIPISLGVSKTKTLAKIAAKLCKQYPKLNNSCLMYRDADIGKVLSKFPVEDIWGIGRGYSSLLHSHGIITANQFAEQKGTWVKSQMGISGLKSWQEIKGIPSIEMEENERDKQQICTSRTFAHESYDHEEVVMAVARFTSACAQKLRAQSGLTSKIIIFFYPNRFKQELSKRDYSIVIPLEYPSDNTLELVKIASSALIPNLSKGCGYKKVGVIFSDITRKEHTPGLLFDPREDENSVRLMHCIDSINTRYGRETLYVAAQGSGPFIRESNNLSPRYTTDWSDIITVKI